MARPSRIELVKRFFPELGSTGTGGETEAAIEINTRACEAILSDQIKLYDEFYEASGPGILCLKLAEGDRRSHYVTLDDLCADLLLAEGSFQPDVASFLKDAIRATKSLDQTANVLIMLMDGSKTSLLPLSRDYPAKMIQALQEEITA
jgi:hypothetical protein